MDWIDGFPIFVLARRFFLLLLNEASVFEKLSR